MLSIFSYIWTKCFFDKYQIQLIWPLHPVVAERGSPHCFSEVGRYRYITHKYNKSSGELLNSSRSGYTS